MHYITTPIYYVNDKPHIGHAYTSIAADIIARFYRLFENHSDVMFLTGTDEHGQKVQKSAENLGIDTKVFCDQVSAQFQNLKAPLNLSNDYFIRTTNENHKQTVLKMWKILEEKGYIYKSFYEGWYSTKDEAFVPDNEVTDGKDSSGYPLEFLKEESYFFKLSAFEQKLLEFYESHQNFIKPAPYMKEVVSFVKSGLKDLSISRTSFTWGIKVPNDPTHVIYVWLDALCNYLSALNYLGTNPNVVEHNERAEKFWKESVHLLGKDILKFHAVYWPAFLIAADLTPPKQLIVHGWWTVEGQKMSKSLGNTIDPFETIEKYGCDQFRYFLFKESNFGYDCNFSEKNFIEKINYDLCNDYGNLVHRVLTLAKKTSENEIFHLAETFNLYKNSDDLSSKTLALSDTLKENIKNGSLTEYLKNLFEVISLANKYVNDTEPWKLLKSDLQKFNDVISELIKVIIDITVFFSPFIPSATQKVMNFMGIEKISAELLDSSLMEIMISAPSPIFTKIETKEGSNG